MKGQREFPQVGVMADVDNNTVKREKRRWTRSHQTNSDNQLHGSSSTDSTESEISIDNLSSGDEFRPKTLRPTSVISEIPTQILSKEAGSTADRVNVSVRSHLLLQASFVITGGADINPMSL